MPPLTLSAISVYRAGQDPSDPEERPLLTMTFPPADKALLRSVVEANRRLYNAAAVGVAVAGELSYTTYRMFQKKRLAHFWPLLSRKNIKYPLKKLG